MDDQTIRKWIWISIASQAAGYAVDVAWHGLVNPGVEPATVGEMARHLATIHLPLYIGAACVLLSTITGLLRRTGRSSLGVAPPVAVAGAVVSAGAEAWHAYSHLQLDTSHAPVAGVLSLLGFLVVLGAMSLSAWTHRHHRGQVAGRRAAG